MANIGCRAVDGVEQRAGLRDRTFRGPDCEYRRTLLYLRAARPHRARAHILVRERESLLRHRHVVLHRRKRRSRKLGGQARESRLRIRYPRGQVDDVARQCVQSVTRVDQQIAHPVEFRDDGVKFLVGLADSADQGGSTCRGSALRFPGCCRRAVAESEKAWASVFLELAHAGEKASTDKPLGWQCSI